MPLDGISRMKTGPEKKGDSRKAKKLEGEVEIRNYWAQSLLAWCGRICEQPWETTTFERKAWVDELNVGTRSHKSVGMGSNSETTG